ncbi:MAG: hypothetical protein WA823_09950 [Candidatus Acidiferrales bacterium]
MKRNSIFILASIAALACGASSLELASAHRAILPQDAGANARPSASDLQARTDKLIENQHHDDQALEEYERVERQVDRSGGPTPRVLEDKLYRIVPTGTGTLKILLRDDGKDVDPSAYRQQLQAWREVLELMLKPDDPRTKSAYAKAQKKKQDRVELVAATRQAYIQNWLTPETINGRLCDVIDLTPDPNFHPKNIYQDAMTKVTAKIWVDRASLQLARAEAHVTKDLSIGGGILGKLYKGGVFSFEQAEVAPGLWLPVRYQFDYSARKFLFLVEEHQLIEVSQYRYDGPPKQALTVAINDLASGKMFAAGQ